MPWRDDPHLSRLVKRSITLARHRTSIALEPEFWVALDALAAAQGRPLAALVGQADATRDPAIGLASMLRVIVLRAAQGIDPAGS